jgi:hypothetical protein
MAGFPALSRGRPDKRNQKIWLENKLQNQAQILTGNTATTRNCYPFP